MKHPSTPKSTTYAEIHQRKSVQQQQQQQKQDNNYFIFSGKQSNTEKKGLTSPNHFTSPNKRIQTSPFENTESLKDAIKSIHNSRYNSPTQTSKNPITQEGYDNVFKSSVKKTKYSDVDNIRDPPKQEFKSSLKKSPQSDIDNIRDPPKEEKIFKTTLKKSPQADIDNIRDPPKQEFKSSLKKSPQSDIDNIRDPPKEEKMRKTANGQFNHLNGTTEQKDWKPTIKKIDVKESQHYEVFNKRGLKSALYYSGTTSSTNPLLGQEENTVKKQKGSGNQVISEEYQRINNKKYFDPSNVSTSLQRNKQHQSTIFSAQTSPKASNTVSYNVPTKFRGDEAKYLIGYGYGLPFNSKRDPTDKVSSITHNRYNSYDQLNTQDFRKKCNVLQKEEKAAQKGIKNFFTEQSLNTNSSQIQLTCE